MKLKFIFFGKRKKNNIQFLIDQYLNRLESFSKLSTSFLDNNKKNEVKLIKDITARDLVVTLDELGKEMSSVEYASFINQSLLHHTKIIFIVGDAFSVPVKLKKRSNFIFSLSKMTLPHLFARLVLVEQTYRAFTIFNNHPYHHE